MTDIRPVALCGGREQRIRESESIHIPAGAIYVLADTGKKTREIIEVQTGGYLGKNGIARVEALSTAFNGEKKLA